MPLRERIEQDMKAAMKDRDPQRTSALRMLRAAILTQDKAGRGALDDQAIQGVIQSLIKQRREAATAYRSGGREETAQQEEREAELLQGYLPEPLSPEALQQLVARVVAESGATSIKEMGRVMAAVKEAAAGRADMGRVSGLVKKALSGG